MSSLAVSNSWKRKALPQVRRRNRCRHFFQATDGRLRLRRSLLWRYQAARSTDRRPRAQQHPLAMEFLGPNTKELWDVKEGKSEQFSELAKGKNVVIIGGGDTGTDCVGTSLRHGCKSVVQLEIMPKPPAERAADNPWPEWPKTYKMDYGQEEAAAIQGEDPRQYLVSSSKFEGDADVTSKQSISITSNGPVKTAASSQRRSTAVSACSKPISSSLQWAFSGLKQPSLKSSVSTSTPGPTCKLTTVNSETSIEGVFAAGDMRRGQSLIVWAINEGRAAARECDKFLMGTSKLP